MDRTYWYKQTAAKPLFPDLLWSRPENKHAAGKLLTIGGNSQNLGAPVQAYAKAETAGIGSCRVILPEAVRKTVQGMDNVDFAASTPSGSFATAALADWLDHAGWSDGVLLAGDLGHNSETTILIEKFLTKYKGQVTLVGDTLDQAINTPEVVLGRAQTLLAPTLNQLQKIVTLGALTRGIKSDMDLLLLLDVVHELTIQHQLFLVVEHNQQLIVAAAGKVSTTPVRAHTSVIDQASKAAVLWLQNPNKPFEAITMSSLTIPN